jgi:DNA-binding transcriptional MerR regulator
MDALTIGQLGQATGTKIETIRYHKKIGLLPAPRRP